MTGTISYVDIYGPIPPGRKKGETAPASVETASGKSSGAQATQKQPAIFWVVLVGLLAALRFAYETGSSGG